MAESAYALATDGTRLAFDIHGAGEPLVLLSGQAQDRHMWDLSVPLFAQHFQVIRLDYRGTGNSDKPRDPPYSTRLLAADTIAILNTLDIERAHIYGISLGGRIGQWLGIDYAERLGALVLGATTPGKLGTARDAEANQWLMTGNIQQVATLQYSAAFAAAHPELLIPAPTPPFARRLHYQASEQHDTMDLLATIRAPTLIIHGSDDRINPTANAHLMASRIPNAKLHLLPGAKHGYVDEFRQEAYEIVSDFLIQHSIGEHKLFH